MEMQLQKNSGKFEFGARETLCRIQTAEASPERLGLFYEKPLKSHIIRFF